MRDVITIYLMAKRKIATEKSVILFDLDGALTPPRRPLEWSIVPALRKLARYADVGIVSGSPFEYIQEQGALMWNSISSLPPANIIIMPCNGTQLFRWSSHEQQFVSQYELDFKSHLNDASVYKKLVRSILELQLKFMDEYADFMDLTGNFLSYRGSMVNWSPVGRDAKPLERAAFEELDRQKNVRDSLCTELRAQLDILGLEGVVFALGGATSIDIYPQGWDKTHALNHCADREVWFVGDKCDPGGNDHTIWKKLNKEGRAYTTSGPAETKRIIEEEILPAVRAIHG